MNAPRVLIAGTSSASGKTTATCAVLSLLRRRGLDVRACKCGPDYIDPMFHRYVTGVTCTNLDPFFCDKTLLRRLLCDNAGGQVTVIEGVMGYYDGTGADGADNSTYTVAERTDTPAILVVDGRGASTSLLAAVEGFLRFNADSRIRGVLFNRVTGAAYSRLAELTERRFGGAVAPVGYMPELPEEYRIPSRHLGLVTADELDGLRRKLNGIADVCGSTIDVERIMSISKTAGEIPDVMSDIPSLPRVRIAVARDSAFCFYYDDTLRLFESMGAELLYFSPLANEPVPEDADGLLLGGGYPELYADALERNTCTGDSVRRAVLSGMPTIAECGGFMYLGRTLDGRRMCNVLPHRSAAAGRLVRFGYVTLTARDGGVLGPAGTTLRGHEFHYWDSDANGRSFTAVKPNGRSWDCAVHTPTLYAGYPHLYLRADVAAAESFYKKCIGERKNNV